MHMIGRAKYYSWIQRRRLPRLLMSAHLLFPRPRLRPLFPFSPSFVFPPLNFPPEAFISLEKGGGGEGRIYFEDSKNVRGKNMNNENVQN